MEPAWADQQQEEAALNEWITQYTPYVYAIIRNFSKGVLTPSDLEELTADVFIRLWEHRQQVQMETLSAYLAAIARNVTKNWFRQHGKHLPNRQEWETLQLTDDTDICKNAETTELFSHAVAALQMLPNPEREILVRFYFYGEKTTEIATALSLTNGTVRVKLHRGREKLRKILEERGFSHAEL